MVRSPCCEKNSVKKGVWTAEKDPKILSFVPKHGSGNWTSVPKKIGPNKRCGKSSCRLRWNNSLKHDLKEENFTTEEEDLIIRLHSAIGSRWNIISQQLPGRTDNDVKIYWNTKLKKKLTQMGIDPVTHKPFSKLIVDYGNIGISQNPSSLKSSEILLRSEQYQSFSREFRNINDQPNHNENISTNFTQFQAIPMVTGSSNCTELENETIPTSIFGENCLSKTSSPSSSSACSTSTRAAFPIPFSWNEFLLEDAFEANGDNQEQSWNKMEVMSQQVPSNDDFKFSSSTSDISFVDAMLDQENEMFLSFPHLMEEPSNY